jgi:hypothetical protein
MSAAFAIVMLMIFGWVAVLRAAYMDDRPAPPPRAGGKGSSVSCEGRQSTNGNFGLAGARHDS